ncbi:MAG: DNA topoisomerase IV [Bacteroidetes bacterium CG18_big_fil_WC_8_21_14_2_50_41_14]|nr:MAG: DNA topoisomerase IV [Bacteroidetes bacterium CG18_big_fil_WC_8_21_14_2_50_41_14]PJB54729.1 MAG: DNA topoisomerase IV [Bacteroidetes bacterium CG_4_9_14_3_um_filter_41_19]
MSELEEINEEEKANQLSNEEGHRTTHLTGMYENWFLDYASYVILERAVPEIDDGLKPVQRRILHAMSRLDDGRYNKVANIIGHTMQFHPHGDASIGDALVQLGQKELLIDMQGNWGNTLTGDQAAAPRYIEARLSKFAKEVVFNPKTTQWKPSYDGRNKEPVVLPVKFPLLLAQGVEGIAVGLASKILPHNFNELIDASIAFLQGKEFEILPDFLTGGMADVSKYNEGLRGGKVRIRAKIAQIDKKTLVIKEIPFSTTTATLIESIVAANDKGKIKIRKIDDNTAEDVEIVIHLANNVSPDQTIDALYAFTNCEVSISPNNCVIKNDKPMFISVNEILINDTNLTVKLLKTELEIRMDELEDQWHNSSLEKIFIENRIYLSIEDCETWESVLTTIDEELNPYKSLLKRPVEEDDLLRLTEIKIKRISKYNSFKADETISTIEAEMEEVRNHLDHLIEFAINYFRQIKKKYGKGRERRTEIRNFDTINASNVAVANEKLYVDRVNGFVGTSLKKDEFVTDCSDIDDMIILRENGTCIVCKVAPKVFVGQDIIHVDVFKRNNDRTIYNMVYRDGKLGNYYVKRFAVVGITRDKEYDLTSGSEESKVVYLTANPNGEAEIVKVSLRPRPKLKKLHFDFEFSSLAIKGRSSRGNLLTKNAIKSITQREGGVSTLGALNIWYDDSVRRLNSDERGVFIGAFTGDEKILTILSTGEFKLTGYDQSTHFDDEMISITKFDPDTVISAIYYDGEQGKYFVKRFQVPDNSSVNKPFLFISEGKGSKLTKISLDYLPRLSFEVKKDNTDHFEYEVVPLADFIAVKSFKAKGKRLSNYTLKSIKLIDPIPYTPPETEEDENGVFGTEEDLVDELEIDPTEPTDTRDEDIPNMDNDKFKEERDTPPTAAPKPPLPRKRRPEDEPPQLELEF